MDRGKDRRYYEERPPFTDAYRPSDRAPRSPLRVDSYRGDRSPPRRGRTPPSYIANTYAPAPRVDRARSRSPRRRSRSPATRGWYEGGSYRGRPRSPPVRGYSPRREPYIRSPPRSSRRYSRSPPARARSPPLPVKRDLPATTQQPRSLYRGRPTSPPRERYERREYSPALRETPSRYPPTDDNYRPGPRDRSRSPPRRSTNISRPASPMSSHGSSRHIHPDRMNPGSGTRSPAYPNTRQPAYEQVPNFRERSPPRRPRSPPLLKSPQRSHRQRSPPPSRRRESPPLAREDYRNGQTPMKWSEPRINLPSGPNYRNGDSRAPPSAPAYQDHLARESQLPSGPPSAPISMSAHNRPSSATILSAPTRPRGGGYGHEYPHPRDTPYGANRGRGATYRGGQPPSRHSYDSRSLIDGPPAGPRGPSLSSHGHTQSRYDHHDAAGPHRPPFRSNNSSSTTYPRTQRFNTHTADLSRPVPGGKISNTGVDPQAEKRLQELDEQKRKLLEAIDEKQAGKRKAVREWERGEQEVKRDGLRSELAEESLEALAGDGGGVGAAF